MRGLVLVRGRHDKAKSSARPSGKGESGGGLRDSSPKSRQERRKMRVPPGLHKMTPRSPNAQSGWAMASTRGPQIHEETLRNTTKNPREDLPEREERKMWRVKKKVRPLSLRAPPFGATTLRGPSPSGPHPSGPPTILILRVIAWRSRTSLTAYPSTLGKTSDHSPVNVAN